MRWKLPIETAFWTETKASQSLPFHSERAITDTVTIHKPPTTTSIKSFFLGSYQRYSVEQTLKIVLLDINDQYPIIETRSLEISESLEKGTTIATAIIATDKDDPTTSNTDIQFTLKGLQDADGNEVEQLFEIASQELTGVAYLSTIKDLKNYFGEYKLIIEVST